MLHVIVPIIHFEGLKGGDRLAIDPINTHQARHTFCQICRIYSIYYPHAHPDDMDIHRQCLDDDVLNTFKLETFDGQNWEDNLAQIP